MVRGVEELARAAQACGGSVGSVCASGSGGGSSSSSSSSVGNVVNVSVVWCLENSRRRSATTSTTAVSTSTNVTTTSNMVNTRSTGDKRRITQYTRKLLVTLTKYLHFVAHAQNCTYTLHGTYSVQVLNTG